MTRSRLSVAALSAAISVLAVAPAMAATTYHLTDLGPDTYGSTINAQGDVAGVTGAYQADKPAAAVWHVDTGAWAPLAKGTNVQAMNDRGTVVGGYEGDGFAWGVRWSADGRRQRIAPEGATMTLLTAILDDGSTYGYFTDAAYAYHPAKLVDGAMVDLGCPTQAGCIGFSANRQGVLAGQIYHDDAQLSFTAAVYRDGAWTDLGSFGGRDSFASGVNARGKVVGAAMTRNQPGYLHAFLWNGSTMRDLHTLGGHYSIANGINNLDVVAGAAEDANGVLMAATWSQGAWTPLAPLVENLDGFTLDAATAITDDGRILVNTVKDNFAHAIVLTPVTR